jgi:hypothetical protein
MEGFKSLPKMQCFKEGGAVKSKYAGGGSCYKKGGHAESKEMEKDITQDKSMVKRGVKQHEEALHKDEPKTKLKLKTGGKSKLVGKYKTGGAVKKCAEGGSLKPVDSEENPGLAKLPTNVRNKMGYAKKGGLAKKYANGGMVTDEEKARMPAGKLPQQIVDEEATKENVETREMVAGPLRKLKRGLMETFKSKSKTPMKHGGKAC